VFEGLAVFFQASFFTTAFLRSGTHEDRWPGRLLSLPHPRKIFWRQLSSNRAPYPPRGVREFDSFFAGDNFIVFFFRPRTKRPPATRFYTFFAGEWEPYPVLIRRQLGHEDTNQKLREMLRPVVFFYPTFVFWRFLPYGWSHRRELRGRGRRLVSASRAIFDWYPHDLVVCGSAQGTAPIHPRKMCKIGWLEASWSLGEKRKQWNYSRQKMNRTPLPLEGGRGLDSSSAAFKIFF
jgi:hypothetical protein